MSGDVTTDTLAKDRDKTQAPDPDDPSMPDSPKDLEKRSWKYVAAKTLREFSSDQCTDIAASLTYYAVLSIFPALIAIFSLLGVFGQGKAASDAVMGIIEQVAPGDTADAIRGPIEQIAGSPAAGFALITGIVLAVWSASGYVGAFSRAMNRIYEIDEGRPFWKLKPVQLLVTLAAIVLLVVATTILVISGPVTKAVGDALGVGDVAQTVWSILKWPVLAFIVVLIVAILYYATPNAKQPKFRWISIGALFAIIVLAVATLAFGFYVANFSSYDRTYGSLAGIVIFLLWLWIANLALLFGAEFDAELERGRQLQAGIAAEEQIQLPPRDTRKIDKAAAVEAKDIARGRRIREQHRDDDRESVAPHVKSDRVAPRPAVARQRIDVEGLSFEVFSTRAAKSDAAPIVLIHGIGMSHRYLARLHRELATTSDVFSIDLPGFGGLPKPSRSLTVADMARALGAVLDRRGIEAAVLVGHSMGAQWVVELAAQRPELASAVVAIGPVSDSEHRTVRAQSLALAKDTLGEPLGGNALVFSDYVRCGPSWYRDQLRRMVSYRIEDRVAALGMPLLVVRGSHDPIAGMAWSRRLRDRAASGSLAVVPYRRHLVQYSAPRAVASAVRTFIAAES